MKRGWIEWAPSVMVLRTFEFCINRKLLDQLNITQFSLKILKKNDSQERVWASGLKRRKHGNLLTTFIYNYFSTKALQKKSAGKNIIIRYFLVGCLRETPYKGISQQERTHTLLFHDREFLKPLILNYHSKSIQ